MCIKQAKFQLHGFTLLLKYWYYIMVAYGKWGFLCRPLSCKNAVSEVQYSLLSHSCGQSFPPDVGADLYTQDFAYHFASALYIPGLQEWCWQENIYHVTILIHTPISSPILPLQWPGGRAGFIWENTSTLWLSLSWLSVFEYALAQREAGTATTEDRSH